MFLESDRYNLQVVSIILGLGVNITNVSRPAFACADINCAKRQSSHQCLFSLLGSLRAKAALKMLVNLTSAELWFLYILSTKKRYKP